MRQRCLVSIPNVILFLIVLVILLQIFHIYLMQHQEDIQNERYHHTSSRYRISPEVRNAYRTDSSGYYFIVQDIFGSGEQHAPADLAIVTHTTSNHLPNLLHLSRRWEGLISVSVFIHGQDAEFALHLSQRLYACYKEIQQKVIFHLVFPVSCNITNIPYHQVNCDVEDTIKSSNKNFELGGKLKYPHNVLRNLALKTVEARFVLAMDIDMLPSANLFSTFQKFFISSITTSNHTAYILPVFETGENYNIPSTKDELFQDKNIQSFYANVCQKCQYITDYDRWKRLRKSEKLDVAYDLQWTHPYEPFYIASKSSLPLYDERFKQYGFNRVSQICEMHVAGYKFSVLNNAFLVHKGYKNKSGFYWDKDKDHLKNKALYKIFKEELKSKYPNSQRHC